LYGCETWSLSDTKRRIQIEENMDPRGRKWWEAAEDCKYSHYINNLRSVRFEVFTAMEDSSLCLSGCYAMQWCSRIPPFWRIVLFPFSGGSTGL
jgi:hypothetical protein